MIGNAVFHETISLKTIVIDERNTFIKCEDNIFYTTSDMNIITYLIGNNGIKDYTIPSYIKKNWNVFI